MSEFTVVPRSEVPEIGPGVGRRPGRIAAAMETGAAVFIPAGGQQINRGRRSYLVVRGFTIHARKGERAGVDGTFYWAEKSDA